jgi:hypothetical protein
MTRPRRRLRQRWRIALLSGGALLLTLASLALILPSCGVWERGLFATGPQPELNPLSPPSGTSAADPRVVKVRFLGHSTVVLEQSGHWLVTDPVLSSTMGGAFRRGARAPGIDALPSQVDAVLITHYHFDHFNRWTLGRLDHRATLIGPRGLTQRAADLGFAHTVELQPWQSTDAGPWKITAVPAWHPTGRDPRQPYDPATTVGYVIECGADGQTAGLAVTPPLAKPLASAPEPRGLTSTSPAIPSTVTISRRSAAASPWTWPC